MKILVSEVQNLPHAPPRGGGGIFKKIVLAGKFLKVVTLGKLWKKTVRKGDLLFIINCYRI